MVVSGELICFVSKVWEAFSFLDASHDKITRTWAVSSITLAGAYVELRVLKVVFRVTLPGDSDNIGLPMIPAE